MAASNSELEGIFRSLLKRSRDSLFELQTEGESSLENLSLQPSPLRLECSVCFENHELTAMFELECGHLFCTSCLRQHCSSSQKDGKTEIDCPSSGCSKQLTQSELRRLLGEAIFGSFERRALERAVAEDPSLHLCSSPDCTFVYFWVKEEEAIAGKELPKLDCPVCGQQRCLLCSELYHPGLRCEEVCEAATQAFLASPEAGIRICPRCKNGITRSSGCGKMKCRCGYRMCYECGSENAQCGCTPSGHGFIDNTTGYGDFSDLYQATSPT